MPIKHHTKRIGGRRGKQTDVKDAWKNVPLSETGKTARLQFYVPLDLMGRMERVAPMLIHMEKTNKGSGIKKNTPGLFSKYCVRTITESLEKLIAQYGEQ